MCIGDRLDVDSDELPYPVDDLDAEDVAHTSNFFPDEFQAAGDVIHGETVEFGILAEVLNFHDVILVGSE